MTKRDGLGDELELPKFFRHEGSAPNPHKRDIDDPSDAGHIPPTPYRKHSVQHVDHDHGLERRWELFDFDDRDPNNPWDAQMEKRSVDDASSAQGFNKQHHLERRWDLFNLGDPDPSNPWDPQVEKRSVDDGSPSKEGLRRRNGVSDSEINMGPDYEFCRHHHCLPPSGHAKREAAGQVDKDPHPGDSMHVKRDESDESPPQFFDPYADIPKPPQHEAPGQPHGTKDGADIHKRFSVSVDGYKPPTAAWGGLVTYAPEPPVGGPAKGKRDLSESMESDAAFHHGLEKRFTLDGKPLSSGWAFGQYAGKPPAAHIGKGKRDVSSHASDEENLLERRFTIDDKPISGAWAIAQYAKKPPAPEGEKRKRDVSSSMDHEDVIFNKRYPLDYKPPSAGWGTAQLGEAHSGPIRWNHLKRDVSSQTNDGVPVLERRFTLDGKPLSAGWAFGQFAGKPPAIHVDKSKRDDLSNAKVKDPALEAPPKLSRDMMRAPKAPHVPTDEQRRAIAYWKNPRLPLFHPENAASDTKRWKPRPPRLGPPSAGNWVLKPGGRHRDAEEMRWIFQNCPVPVHKFQPGHPHNKHEKKQHEKRRLGTNRSVGHHKYTCPPPSQFVFVPPHYPRKSHGLGKREDGAEHHLRPHRAYGNGHVRFVGAKRDLDYDPLDPPFTGLYNPGHAKRGLFDEPRQPQLPMDDPFTSGVVRRGLDNRASTPASGHFEKRSPDGQVEQEQHKHKPGSVLKPTGPPRPAHPDHYGHELNKRSPYQVSDDEGNMGPDPSKDGHKKNSQGGNGSNDGGNEVYYDANGTNCSQISCLSRSAVQWTRLWALQAFLTSSTTHTVRLFGRLPRSTLLLVLAEVLVLVLI